MTRDGFDRLKAQLRRDEGSRLQSYRDPAGNLTIGVGHNIDAHPITITSEQEAQLLDEDIARAMTGVLASLPWVANLDEPRQRVLYNMAFNLGTGGLLQFHRTLEAVRRGDYEAASIGMLASRWADQVGQRAIRLAQVMRTGLESS